MAQGLYGRVTGRGFPSQVTAGMTGEGALESQGGTADPAHGIVDWGAPVPATLQGFQPEGAAGVYTEVLADIPGPGSPVDPDQTPGYGPGTFRTHAAPVPGWAGSYDDQQAMATLHRNSAEIHAQDFGALKLQDFTPGQSEGGVHLPMDPWSANEAELGGVPNPQVPLTGPQRVLGGMDAVQGYDLRNRYGFDAGHKYRAQITGNVVNAYLDPAERPQIWPQGSGSYIPTDSIQGPEPWVSDLNAANINYDDPSAYEPPAQPATLTQPLLSATAWGW